jgi:hypothetical protein
MLVVPLCFFLPLATHLPSWASPTSTHQHTCPLDLVPTQVSRHIVFQCHPSTSIHNALFHSQSPWLHYSDAQPSLQPCSYFFCHPAMLEASWNQSRALNTQPSRLLSPSAFKTLVLGLFGTVALRTQVGTLCTMLRIPVNVYVLYTSWMSFCTYLVSPSNCLTTSNSNLKPQYFKLES